MFEVQIRVFLCHNVFSYVIKHGGDEHCRAACYRLGMQVIPVRSDLHCMQSHV